MILRWKEHDQQQDHHPPDVATATTTVMVKLVLWNHRRHLETLLMMLSTNTTAPARQRAIKVLAVGRVAVLHADLLIAALVAAVRTIESDALAITVDILEDRLTLLRTKVT